MVSPDQPFIPARAIDEVADFLADSVEAANFPDHRLRFRNDRAAAEVGLAGLSDPQWLDHFGRFQPFEGSLPQPVALRYHGHQFRSYNPQIGDGRGFLFAQCRDGAGRLMDFGTKGSGTTPYSRFGDGRLTLKGAVREILATEMLEALGVETSRTLSVVETGEQLMRGDEPSPTRSAVLVRLSHGHIRIGSFQRLAMLGLEDELRRLTAYCLKHYFDEEQRVEHAPHVQGSPGGRSDPLLGPDAPQRLLAHTVRRTARLAASYMAAGFVHGVLNTDNINITGESFDYGPWRFAPTFDAGFTAAYFDERGLYSFGRQAEAIHWNLVQLATALRPLADSDTLAAAIEPFGEIYVDALIERFLWRLGVASQGRDADIARVQQIERDLTESGQSIDRYFFDARERRDHPYWSGQPCSMLIEEVEALWAPIAEADDWAPLRAKIATIRSMGEALAAR